MNETFEYTPIGVCSRKMSFIIKNDIIENVIIQNGCPGYSTGLIKLIIGMNINDVINKLKGIKCGFKNTSCPDQLAKALEEYKKIKV